ncbi:heterocyst frequency control protein PatD [Ancylothrix sp. C2]|uniref:heterocyst frequency control protein PatD n=1 Tax=Ancylothrix sp. D3o TaxID=2953691 RepID=UPI0021BA5353|nr:heterocyst frequency control protein PatD [Ancylothrix sp. D3o]MCT7948940.1 heterocyst frequency control protein PatD [Ancylothrix sp. D3o]
MLKDVYSQRYQEFTALLSAMSQSVETEDGLLIKQALKAVQEFFGAEILGLPVDQLSETIEGKVRSYQTEIHKQLRLLATDVMFLAVSRSKTTVAGRLATMRERLTLVERFCEAVLSLQE